MGWRGRGWDVLVDVKGMEPVRSMIISPKVRRAKPKERAKYSSSAVYIVSWGLKGGRGYTNVMALELRGRGA